MRILSLEWRNFNSYGNVTQRVDFPSSGGLCHLMGENGHGKSTIAEALTFALFGRVDKKNKSDLVNRINKELWCRVETVCRNKRVVIERGVAPAVFEVTVDGTVVGTAGVVNVQSYLEDELFDVPYHVFRNILVLNISDFKSFLFMTPADKRNIVDRLFGYTIINEMRELAKTERREVRDSSVAAAAEVGVIASTIESMNMRIEQAERDKQIDREQLLAELKEQIRDARRRKAEAEEGLAKVSAAKGRVTAEKHAQLRARDVAESELRTLRSRLALFRGGKCPQCGSDLTSGEHGHVLPELETAEAELAGRMSAAASGANERAGKEQQIQQKVEEVSREHLLADRRTQKLMNDAKAILERKPEDVVVLSSMVEEAKARKEQRQGEADVLVAEDTFLAMVEEVLGDGGVKSHATRAALPTLNQAIADMCKQMHLPYDVKLDERFDCVVTHMGETISPYTLSTGERKKTDIAVVVAVIRMLKLRYPALNTMFLDEAYAGLDPAGIYEATKILSTLSTEHHMNIWVMHHAELPTEMFDRRLRVVKDAGFSRLDPVA